MRVTCNWCNRCNYPPITFEYALTAFVPIFIAFGPVQPSRFMTIARRFASMLRTCDRGKLRTHAQEKF